MTKYDVFISYSRKDTAIADKICAAFDRNNISYFIDRQSIVGGMEFPDRLAEAIVDSEIFLLLASENAYQSMFTRREIVFASNKKNGKNLLPYIIDNSSLPLDIEFVFSSINWRTLSEHPIDTVLIPDILLILGRNASVKNKTTQTQEQPTAQVIPTTDKIKQQELSAEEIFLKGNEYYDIDNYNQAVEWFKNAAEQGHVDAQYYLGYCYGEGQGIEQNPAKEAEWYPNLPNKVIQ